MHQLNVSMTDNLQNKEIIAETHSSFPGKQQNQDDSSLKHPIQTPNKQHPKKRTFSETHDENEDSNYSEQLAQEDSQTKDLETSFLRHVIKQRSGNFPELKRRYDPKHQKESLIFDVISSNENTNRNKKLLQGAEWVSRNKMNNMLYENRVFYNGVEHRLLSRKKSKFNAEGDKKTTKVHENDDEFDINNLCHAESILKPISSLKDVVSHPNIKRTFLNDKIFNSLELQTALMIEKAKMESNVFNKYLSVFLGDDPLPYLESKIKLPEYDHHIDFEDDDDTGKIYLDINDLLKENIKEPANNEKVEDQKHQSEKPNTQIETAYSNDQSQRSIKEEPLVANVGSADGETAAAQQGDVVTTEEKLSLEPDSQVVTADYKNSHDLSNTDLNQEKQLDITAKSTDPEMASKRIEDTEEKSSANEKLSDPPHKESASVASDTGDEGKEVSNNTADESVIKGSDIESDDDLKEDEFFALPRYSKTTLQERLTNLTGYDTITNQQIDFSRQLTQILLQRNQEFIKNLIAIRMHLFKIERIRERIVKWGYEFSGIPEEDVEIPNVLTAVKRGLISASTNRSSASGIFASENQSGGEDEEEE